MLYPVALRARAYRGRLAMSAGARLSFLAERRGFEPPDRLYPVNRLAGGCLQPLGHLSNIATSGGGSRIRTHGAFALRFSRPAPSTTRPSLRETAEWRTIDDRRERPQRSRASRRQSIG